MKKQMTLLVALSLLLALPSRAQEGDAPLIPNDMWEIGTHAGHFFILSDVNYEPGWAAGIHIRKSIDYLISIRVDGVIGQANGMGPAGKSFTNNWLSTTGYGIFSLNIARFNNSVKKVNYYAMIGVGSSFFETEYFENADQRDAKTRERALSPHIAGGAGLAFRLSKRVNIGLEHTLAYNLGVRGDQLDGMAIGNSALKDMPQYTSIRLNFNIGSTSNKTEPLYWVNPLESVYKELDDVKELTESAITDTDGDGVIDAIDQEADTPPDVPVDTKGRTLDSDRDGVPDYKDREPYYPPRAGEQVNSEGVVINPINAGVSEDRVKQLIDEALQDFKEQLDNNSNSVIGGGAQAYAGPISEMFLPMIHFGIDSDRIKYSDYGNLASIARVLKGNPQMKLVIIGFADKTGPESYNKVISFKRAKAVVDHFVTNHGIGRGRLVLQYKGDEEALVPTSSSYMNRRVEFRTAAVSDVEMDPPANSSGKKKSGF